MTEVRFSTRLKVDISKDEIINRKRWDFQTLSETIFEIISEKVKKGEFEPLAMFDTDLSKFGFSYDELHMKERERRKLNNKKTTQKFL